MGASQPIRTLEMKVGHADPVRLISDGRVRSVDMDMRQALCSSVPLPGPELVLAQSITSSDQIRKPYREGPAHSNLVHRYCTI